jgi:hypothetical protein
MTETMLYRLARTTQLLSHLIPEITDLMNTENYLEADFPREPEDGEQTRIFIVYTNDKRHSQMVLIRDPLRLNARFDIDEFMGNYKDTVFEDEHLDQLDPIAVINGTLQAAIEYAAMGCLSFEDPRVEKTSRGALSMMCAILYDDPLDVFMTLTDVMNPETGDLEPRLTSAWMVKKRQYAF